MLTSLSRKYTAPSFPAPIFRSRRLRSATRPFIPPRRRRASFLHATSSSLGNLAFEA